MARSRPVPKVPPTVRPKAPPAVGAVRGALPARQAPQLAAPANDPPAGPDWISELKLDGHRLLVWIAGGRARLVTRNGHDWTARMPVLAARFAALVVDTALLDGELVALRPDGTSSFHDLQAALSDGRDGTLHFYAFDLLHLNGWDLRPAPLLERKGALEALAGWNDRLRFAEHVVGDAAALRREACRLKIEGIICKRASAPYRSGRSTAWLKIKCQGREEFIVLGWTPPGGSRRGVGALALGFFDADGGLHYAGTVGTGFSDRELLAFRERLEPMRLTAPLPLLVAGEAPDRAIRWVRPEVVVELSFTAWSGEGRLRHPAFLGLREDKPADQVVMAIPDAEAPRRKLIVEAEGAAPPAAAPSSRPRWRGAVPSLRSSRP